MPRMGFRIPFVLWPFWVFKHFFARSLMFLIVYCPIKLIKRKKDIRASGNGEFRKQCKEIASATVKKDFNEMSSWR